MNRCNEDYTKLPICCIENGAQHCKHGQFNNDLSPNSIDACEIVDCLGLRAVKRDCYGPKDSDWASTCSELPSYRQSRTFNSQPAGPDSDMGPECFLYDHKSQTAKADIHQEPSFPRQQNTKRYDCHCYK